MNTVENHKNVRRNLLELVKVFPQLLLNRNELVSYYWTIYDHATTPEMVAKATPTESITRNLRRLAEMGQISLPNRTKMAAKQREYAHEFSALT
jgi:hypothetical protein